jgi:hypothetical protein
MPTAKVISKEAGSSQSRRLLGSALMDHSLPNMTMAEKEIPLSMRSLSAPVRHTRPCQS